MNLHRDRVGVEIGDFAGLRPDHACVVAVVVGGQRQVGGKAFPDALAVVPGLDGGEPLQILFDAVGDLQQDTAAFRHRCRRPFRCGLVRGVQGQFDVGSLGARDFAEVGAVHRRGVGEVVATDRRRPFATNEILISLFEFGFGECHYRCPSNAVGGSVQ